MRAGLVLLGLLEAAAVANSQSADDWPTDLLTEPEPQKASVEAWVLSSRSGDAGALLSSLWEQQREAVLKADLPLKGLAKEALSPRVHKRLTAAMATLPAELLSWEVHFSGDAAVGVVINGEHHAPLPNIRHFKAAIKELSRKGHSDLRISGPMKKEVNQDAIVQADAMALSLDLGKGSSQAHTHLSELFAQLEVEALEGPALERGNSTDDKPKSEKWDFVRAFGKFSAGTWRTLSSISAVSLVVAGVLFIVLGAFIFPAGYVITYVLGIVLVLAGIGVWIGSHALKEGRCVKINVEYYPFMEPQPRDAEDWQKCQDHCGNTHGCQYFTYYKTDHICHLASVDAYRIAASDTIAGQKFCPWVH